MADNSAAATAAYLQNLQYRAVNAPETLTPNEQGYAQNYMSAIDAQRESLKQAMAFSQSRNDNQPPSAEFQRITNEYANRYGVTSSGGYRYVQPLSEFEQKYGTTNPYPSNSAAGIAWEIAKTGGASDLRLNAIAYNEIAAPGGFGGNPNFIRYATDIYQERPSFGAQTLVTREGQTFYNPAWSGVPIRMNMTLEEAMAGGGIKSETGKFYQYNPETYMLNKINAPVQIGVDTGVHTRYGDFGGPILQPDGSYGGWSPEARLVGGKTIASEATITQNELPRPFISKPSDLTPSLTTSPDKYFYNTAYDTISKTIAVSPAGLAPALGLNYFTSVAQGKEKSTPLYTTVSDLITPYSQPKGTVTSEQYESNLNTYNTNLSEYNAAKSAYEKSGIGYSELSSKFGELQSAKSALDLQQQNIVNPPSMFDRAGSFYEGMNKVLAPYTTDITGFGKIAAESKPVDFSTMGDTSGITTYSDIINVSKGIYAGATQSPLDIPLTYGAGKLFGAGEYGVKYLAARGATSDIAIASALGRGASTPLAADLAAIGKTALGGYIFYETGENILKEPTAVGRGEVIGRTGLQFAGFGAGYASFLKPEPANPYAGREYFSGERKLPVTEQMAIKASNFINGITQTSGQRVAIREASESYIRNAFTPPEVTTVEPVTVNLKAVSGQKQADIIDRVLAETGSVRYGSGTIAEQLGTSTTKGAQILRDIGSTDVDFFTPSKAIAEARLEQFGGSKILNAVDIHEFPKGYVDVGQETNALQGLGSYLAGNRIQTNPYIDEITIPGKTANYLGKTMFEHLNVQERKLSSAVIDDISDPMNKGYRLGKDISRFTRVGEVLEEQRALRNPSVKSAGEKQFDKLLEQEITYKTDTGAVKTQTLREIRAEYESGKLGGGNTPVSSYSKGAISSAFISSLGGFPPRLPSPTPSRSSRASSPSLYGLSPIARSASPSTRSPSVSRPISPSGFSLSSLIASSLSGEPSSPRSPSRETSLSPSRSPSPSDYPFASVFGSPTPRGTSAPSPFGSLYPSPPTSPTPTGPSGSTTPPPPAPPYNPMGGIGGGGSGGGSGRLSGFLMKEILPVKTARQVIGTRDTGVSLSRGIKNLNKRTRLI